MPTGYTAGIEDGTITTLRDYALTCARAFGACFSLRDEPLGAAPEKILPDTAYYDSQIQDCTATIKRLMDMSDLEREEEAQKAFDLETKRYKDRAEEIILTRQRYESLQSATVAWCPPTALSELRLFMLQQIEISIRSDWNYVLPVRLSGDEWRAAEMKEASVRLARYTGERVKILQRAEESNKWLAEVSASVGVL